VDPIQWYKKGEARERGRKFLEIASWTEVINSIEFLGDIPSEVLKAAEGAIADTFTVDFALDWFHKAGQKLTQCGNEGKHWASCKFTYKNWHIGFEIPIVDTEIGATLVNLFSAPETEKCTAKPIVACSRLNA
jgi:hypothetical protein